MIVFKYLATWTNEIKENIHPSLWCIYQHILLFSTNEWGSLNHSFIFWVV